MIGMIEARAASTPEMLAVFDDAALLRAALAFETALADAEAAEGIIPAAHAKAIAATCRDWTPDPAALAEAASHAGTLAIPLVAALRTRVAAVLPDAAASVHHGATSQDVADTALMLRASAGTALLRRDLARMRTALRALAEREAATPMLGRTLLQAAAPITLGLKAAGWLAGIAGAADRLDRESRTLAVQFGGAVGTRAGLRGKGDAVAKRLAATLSLADAPPWHASRETVAGLGAALGIVTGALGKIARDVSLAAQTEVGELREPATAGRGGSSAMPHKRNPTGCQVALSAALRAPGLVGTLLSALPAEHERGLGGWQAEAPVLAELFALAHGALAALLPVIEGLEIDRAAMARNLTHAPDGDDGEAAALVRLHLGV